MKKLLILIMFSLIIASCEKDESSSTPTGSGDYCAKCKESKTGTVAPDFCGKESDVDYYISELKRVGSSVGQSWSCTKKKQ